MWIGIKLSEIGDIKHVIKSAIRAMASEYGIECTFDFLEAVTDQMASDRHYVMEAKKNAKPPVEEEAVPTIKALHVNLKSMLGASGFGVKPLTHSTLPEDITPKKCTTRKRSVRKLRWVNGAWQ